MSTGYLLLSGGMLYASILCTIIWLLPQAAEAAVACNETDNPCEVLLWKGSQCQDGFCTNPFQGGCLRALLGSEEYEDKYSSGDIRITESMQAMRRRLLSKPRVCNSEDGPDMIERGLCVKNDAEYPEVRLYSQNWESSFIFSWIMQIMYSELLGLPSTIESGMADKNANFYDETNRMEYGTSYDDSVVQNAYDAEGGVCTVYKNGGDDVQPYVPCANIVMETWYDAMSSSVKNGAAKKELLGMVGYQSWHIMDFSVRNDSSLVTHYGLRGDKNRRKMAETFKRPTTWYDYCTLVSSSNCTEDDGVATRPPSGDGSESNKYFALGLYTGHFRATEKNDCVANPTTCTGHIMDFPCGWTSYVKQQTKHLRIFLESDGTEPGGGYTYSDMVDIWFAANFTKSDVIGLWWKPDATASLFTGTESDLTPVLLPTGTKECLDNQVDIMKRCDPDATEFDLYGDSKGACDKPHVNTQKIAVANLQLNIDMNSNPKSRMSPAHEVYEAFSFLDVEVEVNGILTDWISRGVDKYGFDLRFPTCKWMADNLDIILEKFVPPSFPQAFISSQDSGLTIAAIVISAIAILLSVGTTGGVLYKHRKGKLGRATQIEFLLLLLAGLVMVSVGSLLMAVEPSTGSCVGSIWMINIGYAAQLVPTLIRVSTIIQIVRSSMKMKIVKVDKKKLVRKSIGISGIAAVYCLFWTIFDEPKSDIVLTVTGDQNEFGETIVSVSNHCDSDSSIWFYVSFVIQAFLLVCASALAYQMRKVPNSVNDSKPLAFMIYSSFFFLTLRIAMFIFSETLSGDSQSMKAQLQNVRSIFCSLDSIANILIFFTRLFVRKGKLARRGSSFDGDDNPRPGSASAFANNIARRENRPIATVSGSRETTDYIMNQATERFAEEEKVEEKEEFEEEEGSQMPKSTVRIRVKGKSIALPEWVVEKYGSKDNADESKGVDTGFDEETDGWKEHQGLERRELYL